VEVALGHERPDEQLQSGRALDAVFWREVADEPLDKGRGTECVSLFERELGAAEQRERKPLDLREESLGLL
jgi:hypothetical protein